MTERQRILSVMAGKIPDQVPCMLDLSHYYYHKMRKEWNILSGYVKPEYDLIDYHKKFGVGFYLPNQSLMSNTKSRDDVKTVVKTYDVGGVPEISWRYVTPIGEIERIRTWNEATYSWAITKWGITTEQDLRVLAFAMSARTFEPLHENYKAWDDYVGDTGVVYLSHGYSAMGFILNYWMGIENTIYACEDWNGTMHEVIDQINENNLVRVRMLAEYPAPVVIMGDNFSSDYQPPAFFEEWSAKYYREAIGIFHKHGKKVAVHVDGKLRGAIGMIRDAGADVIDATTPQPMGDLSAGQCRDEAGPTLILSGGVSPDLWLPESPVESFKKAALAWLETRKRSSALICNAGDQVPPGAEESRIALLRELVDKHGRY